MDSESDYGGTDEATRRLLMRLEGLIEKGNGVIATDRPPPTNVLGMSNYVDDALFFEWRTQSLNFLTGLLGANHIYPRSFDEQCNDSDTYKARAGKGILLAVQEDLKGGHLSQLAEIMHAETFSDFLEMADYLLKEGGFKDPAAVLAGGVLEVHLRNLCQKNDIDITFQSRDGEKPKKAESMNADLASNAVYMKLDQKSVTAWLDLRNKAAHAEYSAYSGDQVAFFIQGLRDFIARNPA